MNPKQLKVFYDERMIAKQLSASPSSFKPKVVLDAWMAGPLKDSLDVSSFLPVNRTQLCSAHNAQFVDDVLSLAVDNGFGGRSQEVSESLLWTNGAMLAAAEHAFRTRTNALAPVSGFHHAEWANAMGFCTFNGLVIATRHLLSLGCKRVGILDCDMHYGNGTDNILERVFRAPSRTFSVRANGSLDKLNETVPVRHYTFGDHYEGVPDVLRFKASQAFLGSLPKVIAAMSDCDVILYQAGADPHVDDPYGGLLDDAVLRERDHIVFSSFAKLGIPVAWDFAGGYRRDPDGGISPVLQTHTASLEECLKAMNGDPS